MFQNTVPCRHIICPYVCTSEEIRAALAIAVPEGLEAYVYIYIYIIILYHIILYYVMLYYITLYYIISYYTYVVYYSILVYYIEADERPDLAGWEPAGEFTQEHLKATPDFDLRGKMCRSENELQ